MSSVPPAERDRRARLLAALALALLVVAFFAPLLSPSRLLATRDMTEFNYPLRMSWAKLATESPDGAFRLVPQWDSFAHGGQPLHSNPNYGALYPPAWLGLLFPEPWAVGFLAAFQALVAAFGARRLARRLGADESSALVAGLVYAAGPTYLALLQSLIQALGFSWMPWIVDAAFARLDPEARSRFGRADLALASVVALFLLSGAEPGMVMVTGLALVAIVLSRPREAVGRATKLLPPFLLGVALAGIQVLPTLARLADSPRGGAMSFSIATLWSLPPARLPELFLPRLFGDVARPMHGLYFGWGVHDLDYPFLTSISLTLPLTLLGLVALFRSGLPHRAFWCAIGLAGLFLAFGRHNPLYGWLREHLPLFGSLRYPEKFLLLTLFALLFAGACAWRRALDERETRAGARSLELPLALATVLAGVCFAFAFAIRAKAALLVPFLEARTTWELSPSEIAKATSFYREESLVALVFAFATAALFAAARWSRLPRRALAAGFVVLVAGELAVYSRPLLRTIRAEELLRPPAALASVPGSGRLFSTEAFQAEANRLVPARGDLILNWVRAPLDRLSSRSANLFGVPYALDRDFDLTLTRPAARALALYERLRSEPPLAHRLLGAWNVDRIAIQRAPQSIAHDLTRGVREPSLVTVAGNGFALPSARFVGAYFTAPTPQEAEAAAVAQGLPLNQREFLVAAPIAPPVPGELGVAELLADEDSGDTRRVAYRSATPSLLVIATTFDAAWRARAGETDLPLYETAAGYMAAFVPAGEGVVELRFRDPWLGAGAALSVATMLGMALLARRTAAAS